MHEDLEIGVITIDADPLPLLTRLKGHLGFNAIEGLRFKLLIILSTEGFARSKKKDLEELNPFLLLYSRK